MLLKQLFEKICKPTSPSLNSDEAEVQFLKNKFILKVHLTILTLQIISFPTINRQSEGALVRILIELLMVAIFLLFCRTHPLIGQVINTLLTNLQGLVIMNYDSDGVYYGLLTLFTMPCCAYYFTQSIPLTGMTCVAQISIVLTLFKANLIQALSFSDPEVFATRFTNTFVKGSIALQILYLIIAYNLKKKTVELLEANKRTEEALDQQRTFVYSFSHEMRNPMNSLLGNLDLALMSQQIVPEIREMLSTAKVCGVLLLNLINTVLDAGKLGLGKLEVNPVPVRVHDVFQKVWSISHEMITRKELHSHLKISKQVPLRLLLDSHRLNQVLMNLIGNAIKFTEYGLITVSVNWLEGKQEISDECFRPIPYDDTDEGVFEKEYNMYAIKRASESTDQSLILTGGAKEFCLEGVTQLSEKSKGVLKIIIKDTGCGMTEQDLSKLFQKFSQVGEITTRRQIGTGLGLFISKEITENMRGQIRAYSKPKIGSTFIVCIPTTALPLQCQSEHQMSLTKQMIPKLVSKRLRTLVADDSAFNVTLVCNFYTKIGVEVLATASNGQIAYEKYLKEMAHLDIITLDIDMPVMNGKEVCKKIRQYEKENSLKAAMVILISGNYEEQEVFDLLNKERGSGADCFLKKPLVFEELCWALYKYVFTLSSP